MENSKSQGKAAILGGVGVGGLALHGPDLNFMPGTLVPPGVTRECRRKKKKKNRKCKPPTSHPSGLGLPRKAREQAGGLVNSPGGPTLIGEALSLEIVDCILTAGLECVYTHKPGHLGG